MTLRDVIFVCFACHRRSRGNDASLDAAGHLVCGPCYVADPPLEDVNGIFAEVVAHMTDPT
jgi:hypothetical protein